MDILSLRCFSNVADIKSYASAANELQLSTSCVKKHISDLEKELNCQLFSKSYDRSLELSESGMLLLDYVRRIENEISLAKAEIADSNNNLNYDLNISFRTIPLQMSGIISSFHTKYPDIRLSVLQYIGTKRLQNNLIIFPSREPIKNNHTQTLVKENIYLGIKRGHPLTRKNEFSLRDLEHEVYIRRPDSSEIQQLTDPVLKAMLFSPKATISIEHSQTINELIASGIAVSFIPEFNCPDNMLDKIQLCSIQDVSFSHYINIAWPENSYHSEAAKLFVSFIDSYLNDIVKRRQILYGIQ